MCGGFLGPQGSALRYRFVAGDLGMRKRRRRKMCGISAAAGYPTAMVQIVHAVPNTLLNIHTRLREGFWSLQATMPSCWNNLLESR